MSRSSRFSLGTFFWPTVVVVVYVALGMWSRPVTGPAVITVDDGVSLAPMEFKRDLAIFTVASLVALFFGTWLIVLLIDRLRKR